MLFESLRKEAEKEATERTRGDVELERIINERMPNKGDRLQTDTIREILVKCSDLSRQEIDESIRALQNNPRMYGCKHIKFSYSSTWPCPIDFPTDKKGNLRGFERI